MNVPPEGFELLSRTSPGQHLRRPHQKRSTRRLGGGDVGYPEGW
jgi:hypothetical protein